MSPDWIEIYGSYTPDELAVERARLKKLLEDKQGLTAQGYGTKNWQSDLNELRNQFHACQRAINARANANTARVGVMDYSQVRV